MRKMKILQEILTSRFDCTNRFQLLQKGKQIKVQNYSFHFEWNVRSPRSLAAHKTFKLCCCLRTCFKYVKNENKCFLHLRNGRKESRNPMWASTEIPSASTHTLTSPLLPPKKKSPTILVYLSFLTSSIEKYIGSGSQRVGRRGPSKKRNDEARDENRFLTHLQLKCCSGEFLHRFSFLN